MPEIVPRWEWRTFGDHFGDVETLLAESSGYVVESDELYLLSAAGADSVKVRDELVDVKHLLQVDDDGLEQWAPIMKAAFPLSRTELEALLRALEVDTPEKFLGTAGESLGSLLEEVVAGHPQLRAVRVGKRRQRYQIGGCLAELTEVSIDGASTRTLAVESEDGSLVIATVRDLGLAVRPNVSFLRGLKALARFGVERFAVIDVGTNSVKLHIAERRGEGGWHRIVDRAAVTRLGEGLQKTGRLGQEPMTRTMDAIADMAEDARRHHVAAIAAVGTAGLRQATNGPDLVAAVRARCGVAIEVVSGEDEARFAYRAATTGLGGNGSRLVFDTGGGSSQFTFGHGARVDERFSLDVGAARFTEQFGLDGVVTPEVLREAIGAIEGELSRLDGRPTPETVVGMGGAVTNLAGVALGLSEYDPDAVHGAVLQRTEIDRQIELYRLLGAADRRDVLLQPQRAETILAGACIVRAVLGKLASGSLRVSDRGLRHGVLVDRFEEATETVGSDAQRPDRPANA